MKIDGGLMGTDLEALRGQPASSKTSATTASQSAETSHDPFLPLLVAAEHTERLELSTSIAVAFARSPMMLANVAYDLQAFSKGRFTPRPRQPDQGPHREAVLDAVVAPGGADARARAGHPGDLGRRGAPATSSTSAASSTATR